MALEFDGLSNRVIIVLLSLFSCAGFVFLSYFNVLNVQDRFFQVTQSVSDFSKPSKNNKNINKNISEIDVNNQLESNIKYNYCNDGYYVVHLIQGDILHWKDLLDSNIGFLTFANKSSLSIYLFIQK